MSEVAPKIAESWKLKLKDEFQADYFKSLRAFLMEEKQQNTIYPSSGRIFAAFNAVPFDEVKVIILGQDPYHGKGQANGLSFSVNPGIPFPPSLRNIFKEVNADQGHPVPGHGDLSHWARQGVFLLNATLTVRARQPRSHQNQGWEQFTDNVIKRLSKERSGLIFVLWGRYASMKEKLIDTSKHYILKAPHPSPYSANRGFFGCRHFSKTNHILRNTGKSPINWDINGK